jgi:hypothetical protein
VPFAYVLAVVAAAAVIAIGLLGAPSDGIDTGYFAGAVATLIFYVGGFSFLPTVIAIAVAEIFRLRTIIFYVAVGGALGLAAHQLTGFSAFEPRGQILVVLLGGGFAGGLIYWLTAGRLAGVGAVGPTGDSRKQPGG